MKLPVDGPTEQSVDHRSAGQAIVDAIGEAGLGGSDRFELVAVEPVRKWSFDLLIFEEAVLFAGGVKRDPAQDADAKFDARSSLESTRAADDPNGGKGGCEKR